ncbi:MAG TPA: glycosyl transferase group 1 family protein, partial [Gammaproteobacteria bacterium]|nr:glycosyl transferase group 1 family protein [Gammaproteobacteria bacterium]
VLEAMAMQLPVIATAVGGNLEIVLDGETGILVPPENSQMLATAIIGLANNSELRQEMGKAGQQRVLRYFSIVQCADVYRRLYIGLAQKRRTSIRSLVGASP